MRATSTGSSGHVPSRRHRAPRFRLCIAWAVPFSDELRPVSIVDYRPQWDVDYARLASRIWSLQLADEGEVEHVGSTSVPGLAAKDVIDVQVRVRVLEGEVVVERFADLGFRWRPEEWNNLEPTRCGPIPKLVFAPPVGHRPVNVHVRTDQTQGARDTVLFRDFLRAQPGMRDAWAQFKRAASAATSPPDITAYARLKDPAWKVLMYAADAWAERTGWSTSPLRPWRSGDSGG
jgi:GrpB-like predicted nucleotidyltransferase (UPF0157 family)